MKVQVNDAQLREIMTRPEVAWYVTNSGKTFIEATDIMTMVKAIDEAIIDQKRANVRAGMKPVNGTIALQSVKRKLLKG